MFVILKSPKVDRAPSGREVNKKKFLLQLITNSLMSFVTVSFSSFVISSKPSKIIMNSPNFSSLIMKSLSNTLSIEFSCFRSSFKIEFSEFIFQYCEDPFYQESK